MSQAKIFRGTCFEGAPKVLMARVQGAAATNITQATVTALSYTVDQYDSEDDALADENATSVATSTALTPVSSYVYDTLQTDNDWQADSSGYNFKFTAPAASFPAGSKWVRVEVWVDPTSGEDFPGGVFVLEVLATAKD
jgi:hypothetical protein